MSNLSQSRPVSPKRIGSPIPLCTSCSTRLISAGAQQTLIELNYLVLLRRKWQRSDGQEEREMLTDKEKNGTSVRRQDGGNQHFLWRFHQHYCLPMDQEATPSAWLSGSLHAETFGEQPGVVQKERLWYLANLGLKSSSIVLSTWMWTIYWEVGPSSFKQFQLSKSVVEK